ncbi:sensor domain-containing phosphodiesterase [Azospirillum halopraeferens]|uniref:sensor domain-containing phosphodiesterase n=1 Tax=Azospirillum halopraeferens TaxID=34010 RepID=UPI000422530B|nr:EAL domain-containing protein [Azospirillum halopraeferens]
MQTHRDRDRFVGFAFAAADLLIETDHDGTILFCAGARCRLTRGDVATLVGRNLADLVASTDRKYLRVLLDRVIEKTRIKPARVVFEGVDDQRFPALLGGCRLDSCPGSLFLTVLLASGPHGPHAASPGSGAGQLLDHHGFLSILEDRIVRAREKGLEHGLTLLLVEGMQAMVDSLPEGAAAEVRQGIDAYLRGISADGESAGQLSADRFGVIHASDVDCQEVQKHIAAIIEDAGGELPGGIRTWELELDETPLDAADAARALVYTVQAFASAQGGEFTISSLEDGARRMMSDAVERIGQLRATIEKRDFVVVFQPIVALATETVHHLEALTRVDGMSSPIDFITFAEDVGLIYDFDLLLTQSVLDTLKAFHKEPKLPDVAINLSAKTLMSPLFLKQFQAVTEPYGALSRKLLIEVTETVVVTDIARLNDVLQKLRSSGFRICLDDVGSGSTSFQSLYGLQVDFAKIDGSFVRGAAGSQRDMAMLRSMVDVCQQLGLALIGEQVEEPEHARLLTDLGVGYAQGYLYGHPSRDFGYFARDWSRMAGKGGKVLKKG